MSFPAQSYDPASAPQSTSEMPQMGQAQSIRLRRPGARPLVFNGTEMAMAMSFTPELPYWYEINIYRSEDQRFALAIRLFYQSETEEDTCQAWDFDSLVEVFDAIENYDAAKDVKVDLNGVASSAPSELTALALELRARTLAARANYSGLVGELFDEMDEAVQAHP